MSEQDNSLGDMASDSEAPTVTITARTEKYRETTVQEIEVPLYEVEDLLQQATRGTLNGVDGETILTELRARQ